ncbi:MAG TPA: glutathione ABC transporter substrate-binding protein [Limnochordia bacterium]|nr:glutathione ABC transporter substrate-binding protein [Limnochordia bacterium]
MPLVFRTTRLWFAAAVVVILTAMVGASSALANVLTIVQGTDIESLDVHRVTSSPSYAVLDHIFDTLFQMTPEGEVVPSLATSFEAMPDGRTYRITLRQGVTFTDGTPFNAHAVKANLERILDPASQAAFASLISPITEINVIDDHTVELVTEEPFGPILTHLTHSGLAMISPAVLEKGNEHVAANPVGTGPFVLKEWRQGERIVLVKNDNYWGERGNIEELVFRVVPDDGARLVELEAGTADIALRVPPSEAERLRFNPDIHLDVTTGMRSIYIYFNVTKPPFDDPRVRQAFNYAVDNEAIVQSLLLGAARPLDAPMPPAVFGYSPQEPYAFDLEKARALLEEAGFDFSQEIVLHHPTGRYVQDSLIADAVRANLRQLGINVRLETLEWTTYLDLVRKPVEENQVQMALLGWGVATMDADYALYELFYSGNWAPSFNLGFYKNERVDELLVAARSTADLARREELYAEAQRLIWEDAPWIFLHSESMLTGIRNNVEGFVVHPLERYLAHTASKN